MRAVSNPYADIHSPSRQILPKAFMEHMPHKVVNDEELHELMCHWDYNPTFFYPKGLRKRKNEQGHDAMYRYILQTTLKGEQEWMNATNK